MTNKAKMTLTMRQFIFQIQLFQYYLDELTPRQFVDVYMRDSIYSNAPFTEY